MTRERRKSYRVTVRPKSDLTAAVNISDRSWQAEPGNISPEGIFVRLEPDAPVDLRVNTEVQVEVTYAGETVVLHGSIRSQRASGYGIFFPKRTEDDYVNPLDRLGHIWAQLQRESMAKRVPGRLE